MRRITFAILLILSSLSVCAQVGDSRRDFSVGVSGGYLMNRVGFVHPHIKQQYKLGPQFGIATRYVCEKYFKTICAVQLEVNYQSLGWKELFEEEPDLHYARTMNYINVPILMQMGWGKEDKGLKFIFEAGPQLGYLLNDKVDSDLPYDFGLTHTSYVAHVDVERRFDYGITAGLGVEFSSVIGHFQLGARYYYGLGDFFDTSKRGSTMISRACHNTISAHLIYLFDIIKTKKSD